MGFSVLSEQQLGLSEIITDKVALEVKSGGVDDGDSVNKYTGGYGVRFKSYVR